MPDDVHENPDLGFRALATETWLEPDPTTSFFATLRRDTGQAQQMEPQDWVQLAVQPRLDVGVPLEVVQLYEVARSALAYGALSYPLFTLASEQLTRVCEAAAKIRCASTDPPCAPKSFYDAIQHLVQIGATDDGEWWTCVRQLRNEASHPRMQSLEHPGEALRFLEQVATQVNRLYTSPVDEPPQEVDP